jgi:septal ring factor EnvC (AmiA/AmiB activator)
METMNRSKDQLQKQTGDLRAGIESAETQLREFQGKLESVELEIADSRRNSTSSARPKRSANSATPAVAPSSSRRCLRRTRERVVFVG